MHLENLILTSYFILLLINMYLVEFNPVQGISNNFKSTKFICEVAEKFNLEQVLLISSDKAVRPKNVMGASKGYLS